MIVTKAHFRVEESLIPSDKVIFLFTALGTKIGAYPYRLFVKRLNKKGYACVVYDYPRRVVLSGDMELWQRFFDEVVSDARGKIEVYKKHGVTHFYSYGVSMGTLFANKLAREAPEISHVILNLSYGDVARNLWTFKSVRKAKLSLVRKGIDEETVRQNLTYLDPIVNAPGLRGKKVMLQLARHDRIFPWEQTKYTKRAFEETHLDMVYYETKYLGHILTATKNVLSTKNIDRFYSS